MTYAPSVERGRHPIPNPPHRTERIHLPTHIPTTTSSSTSSSNRHQIQWAAAAPRQRRPRRGRGPSWASRARRFAAPAPRLRRWVDYGGGVVCVCVCVDGWLPYIHSHGHDDDDDTRTNYFIYQVRDECIVMNGEDKCAALIEAHKVRLRPCFCLCSCGHCVRIGVDVGGGPPLVVCRVPRRVPRTPTQT